MDRVPDTVRTHSAYEAKSKPLASYPSLLGSILHIAYIAKGHEHIYGLCLILGTLLIKREFHLQ